MNERQDTSPEGEGISYLLIHIRRVRRRHVRALAVDVPVCHSLPGAEVAPG